MDNPPFIFFIGNSGAGKDTAMDMMLEYLTELDVDVENVERIITRISDANEDFVSVSVSTFKDLRDQEKFAFYWKVYDTYYGYLEEDIDRLIAENTVGLFNISRSLCDAVQEKYPWCHFIEVTAPVAVTASRVLARSRGDQAQKQLRIERMAREFELPPNILTIANTGTIGELQTKVEAAANQLIPQLLIPT